MRVTMKQGITNLLLLDIGFRGVYWAQENVLVDWTAACPVWLISIL